MDFACKTVDLRDVLRCSFELTHADLVVLETLSEKREWATSASIENITRLERSTVQRSLKRLTDKKLCTRRQENHSEGGYTFHYQAITNHALAERVLTIFEGFRERLGSALVAGNWPQKGNKARNVRK
jgi:predicted transcriptional regulator